MLKSWSSVRKLVHVIQCQRVVRFVPPLSFVNYWKRVTRDLYCSAPEFSKLETIHVRWTWSLWFVGQSMLSKYSIVILITMKSSDVPSFLVTCKFPHCFWIQLHLITPYPEKMKDHTEENSLSSPVRVEACRHSSHSGLSHPWKHLALSRIS